MRIAITHPYSWPDVRRGAERIIIESGRALAARGHDVTVLTSGGRASRRTQDGVRVIRYRRIFAGASRHQHWFGWRVLPALVAGRFDVVHSMAPWDAVSAIRSARLTGHRTVYEELGNPERVKIVQQGDRAARERVIRDVDVFGCMSEFSRSYLRDDWGREGAIIPGGVRLEQYAPGPRRAEPTILFSGALDRPEKRIRELLDAVAVLAERRPEVRVRLSGPGDPGPILTAAPAAARERTTFAPLGEPDELTREYSSAWVTCLPTLTDSFGLVVIESLASGTPVVVGPRGAPREVVDERIGSVATSLEPEPLAAALDRGLHLVESESIVDSCRAVAGRYDWDTAVAPLLEALYADTARR
jgi:glycosyltransferase involved in cell wall biosynthesis